VDVRDPAGPVAKELDPLDVIEEVNGRPVIDAESFEREVLQAKSGSYLRFYVLRMKAGRSGRPQPAFVVLKVP
jgi:S1-C subfamily serine protease